MQTPEEFEWTLYQAMDHQMDAWKNVEKVHELIRARDAEVAEQVRAEVVSEIVAGYLKECAPSGVWMAAWLQQFSEPDDGLIRARDAEVAAKALRDAAAEFYGDDRAAGPYRHPLSGASWLRERADRIEREGSASDADEAAGHVYISTDADGVTSRERCSCPRGEDHEWDAS